jgi:integrase
MQTSVIKETRYSKQGKLLTPIDDSVFIKGMSNGEFKKQRHRSFPVLLYYTAIRREEALRCRPEQFTILKDKIVFDVGKRLKHGIHTPPLTIPRDAPFVNELVEAISETGKGKRIWPYCAKTGYNIVDRAFGFYPHFFRLSRITNFFLEGWTIAQVHSWTGLTLKALDFYIGLVDINKMGMSLSKRKT